MTLGRYILVYDLKDAPVGGDVVLAFIRNNKYIAQWANLFAGVYLIKSQHTAKEIVTSLSDVLTPTDFLVARINDTYDDNLDGLLNGKVWKWFSLDNVDDAAVLKLT